MHRGGPPGHFRARERHRSSDVWLKRTAGQVFPELFRRQLTDKENEAVANPAKFRGQKGAKALAGRDYQERMAAIFAECRRVLEAGRYNDANVHA